LSEIGQAAGGRARARRGRRDRRI
jgi:hypothetical protein